MKYTTSTAQSYYQVRWCFTSNPDGEQVTKKTESLLWKTEWKLKMKKRKKKKLLLLEYWAEDNCMGLITTLHWDQLYDSTTKKKSSITRTARVAGRLKEQDKRSGLNSNSRLTYLQVTRVTTSSLIHKRNQLN